MCKNVFTVNNGIIVLTFHAQELTKGCGRGQHGPGPDWRSVLGPAMTDEFSYGPGRQKRNEFGPGPGLKNPACADL